MPFKSVPILHISAVHKDAAELDALRKVIAP